MHVFEMRETKKPPWDEIGNFIFLYVVLIQYGEVVDIANKNNILFFLIYGIKVIFAYFWNQ